MAELRDLTEAEILAAVRACHINSVDGSTKLTYDHGPYEVTSPTRVAIAFADAVVRACREQLAADVPGADATEQALGLYAAQAEAIREVLDAHAPNTSGNLQARLAQVFAAFDAGLHPHDAGVRVVQPWEVKVHCSKGGRTLRAGMQWRDTLTGSTWELVEPTTNRIYSPSGLGGTPTFWCKPMDDEAKKQWRQDARGDGCVSFCGDSIAANLIDASGVMVCQACAGDAPGGKCKTPKCVGGPIVQEIPDGAVVDHGLHSKPVVDHEVANLRDNATGVGGTDGR